MAKIKNLNVLWMPEGPLLISTVWYRAVLPNKLTPLASIELSWQQKKESHLAARLCWMPCLWLITVSYLLPCMKCVAISGWDFHSGYVRFAVFNLLQTLRINWFTLLDSGHAQLCFFWILPLMASQRPLRAIFVFSSFFIPCNFPLYRMQMHTANKMFSAAKHEGIKYVLFSVLVLPCYDC